MVPVPTPLPRPGYPVLRTTLANGLRVVVAPDATAPVVGVAVYYDVGFRSEPVGRTGFAHLFEHLMFQGSANVAKLEHARQVQGAGGIFNGSTTPDYTNYFEILPSHALELALFLEADRMDSPSLTEENLANQVSVVQEEIRVNVLNRPYGGFPWISLPPVAFDTFANAHNGYGDFAELEAATVPDAQDFFTQYYAPANAVLTVAGDVDPDGVVELVERHFGPIAARPVPSRPGFAEPPLREPRRAVLADALATNPAVAAGWRGVDPVADLPGQLARVVLCDLMTAGDASRLERRLVQQDRTCLSAELYLGTFGDPFGQRDPALLTFEAVHSEDASPDDIVAVVTEELHRVATDGLAAGELDRVRARLAARLFREADQVLERTLALSAFELQRGRPELLNELPGLIAEVTAEQVRQAAAETADQYPAVLELRPGAGSAATTGASA